MLEVIAAFVFVIYALPVYLFLAPGVYQYFSEKHTGLDQSLLIVTFLSTPLLLPFYFAGVMMVALACFGILILGLPIHWLVIHWPQFGFLKKWCAFSLYILLRMRKILSALFGLNPSAPTQNL